MSVVPLHPTTHRWEPDSNLVDAAIGGRVRGTDLDTNTRAWLVATLTARGETTDTIAAWLHCSRRIIQYARAEPVAILTTRLIDAERAAEKALSKVRATATVPGLTALVAERDRLRDQKNRLIADLDSARRNPNCPPPVIILRPTHTPRRRRIPAPTMPLFEIGDTA